jgi:2'-hydroxyisoflavone reductase
MRILVIGGSSFVGRAIVASALQRGHDVTMFNRGRTDPGAFPEAEHLVGDRNVDLSALDGRSWDATVDVCAYLPQQVRTLLEHLGTSSGHVTLVSTISVYGRAGADTGFTEDSLLLGPAWDDDPGAVATKYGELKVGCEQLARELAGDRLLVVRPGYVIGPHDPTHRFTYWVERVAAGHSPMAGPDPRQPLQAVDARDLAEFMLAGIETATVDTFHVTAPDPAPSFAEWLQMIARALEVPLPEPRWVGARDELPLSSPPDWWPKMRASVAKAQAAGFTWRPAADTVVDTWRWVSDARAAGAYEPRAGVGLTTEREEQLIAVSGATG